MTFFKDLTSRPFLNIYDKRENRIYSQNFFPNVHPFLGYDYDVPQIGLHLKSTTWEFVPKMFESPYGVSK